MRILLIVPTFLYKRAYPYFLSASDFPIGYAYIASSLKQAGHEVFGLNPNNKLGYSSAKEMLYDQMQKKIYEVQPDLIATGGLCTDYAFIKDSIQFSRKLAPYTPIVLGGGIATHDTEYIHDLLNPDYSVVGEGEEAMVNLANTYSSGRDCSKIKNIAYWQFDKVVVTERDFDYPDINSRPFPDYEPFGMKDMLDNYSMATRYLYRYPNPYPRPMGIVTARSCCFKCSFCIHEHGSKYRGRSLDNILSEIRYMYAKYNFNLLVIEDELFTVNKNRMKEFCERLIQEREQNHINFQWMFQTHASANLDIETMKLAKSAGCFLFSYGMESASPTILASMNKKTRVEQISNTIKLAEQAKIGFGGNFIFGDPAETPETIKETMTFFDKYCRDIHVNFAIVSPYPGSKVFKDAVSKGIIKDKKKFYEEIDEKFWNMTSMPDKLWLSWAYFFAIATGVVQWLKPVRGNVLSVQPSEQFTKIAGKQIYKVWALCPHCRKDVTFREIIDRNSSKQGNATLRKALDVLSNSKLRKNLLTYARIAMNRYLLRNHELYQTLDLVTTEKNVPLSFVTGCPNCNKKLKIYIDEV